MSSIKMISKTVALTLLFLILPWVLLVCLFKIGEPWAQIVSLLLGLAGGAFFTIREIEREEMP